MSKLGKIFFLLSSLSLVSFVVMRLIAGGWIPFLWICLGLFVGFLFGGFWQDRGFYREFLSMKTTKQGMSMGAMLGLVLILLIAVNFLGVRRYKTFDFSAAQVNSLSDQSKKILAGLNSELKVLYFYQKGAEGVEDNRRAFIELLKKYQDQSSFVKLEFVEVNERPDLTEKYGVNKGSGVVFVDYKDRKSQIGKIDEQELTSALVKVTREKEKSIYFISGHGERDLEDIKSPTGAGALKALLQGSRYTVKSWIIAQNGEIPSDADVVMILGPAQAFLESEIDVLSKYLRRGGGLVLALEPGAKTNLQKFLSEMGVATKDNYLVNFMDTQIGRAVDPRATVGSVFSGTDEITKPFGKNQFVVFRLPMAIDKIEALPAGLVYEPLVKTSEKTMAYNKPQFDGPGLPGSFTVAAVVRGRWPGSDLKAPSFAVVVTGDADFLSNQLLYQNLNRDLALNSVAGLAKEENLISITPKEVGVTQMHMSETAFYLFVFGFILVVPVAFLVLSGTLWFRRRYA